MAGVNKVILVGNLGKDPEVRSLENGVKVARFSLATSETYKDKNTSERITQTEWHNVTLWRSLAEIAEKYLTKGSQVYIEGKLQTRSYQDKDGITKYTTEIVGQNLTMLGGKPSDGQSSSPREEYSSNTSTNSSQPESAPQFADSGSADIDDLPF